METVEALVNGGKASPAPPLGPSLAQTGVNIGQVIQKINEKTKSFAGMEVPVKVLIDAKTKGFEIKVGTSPVSAMIKKEIGADKLATVSEDNERQLGGDIKFDAIKSIAESKDIPGDLQARVKQVLGTCVSCGVTVDGRDPKEVQKEIDEGKVRV